MKINDKVMIEVLTQLKIVKIVDETVFLAGDTEFLVSMTKKQLKEKVRMSPLSFLNKAMGRKDGARLGEI